MIFNPSDSLREPPPLIRGDEIYSHLAVPVKGRGIACGGMVIKKSGQLVGEGVIVFQVFLL